ncbi:MAG: DegT/DnrJ/EryC1/StrS aminotransferase family protein, partial [Zetaproteobacteria bacterium]
FIPFARPCIGEDEIQEVVDALRSGWVTTGPKVAAFEKAFAETVGAKYALAVNSATAGLHLALEAVGVGAGDLVLTTPYTFTATAEVIRYLGADPVFVDIDPDTLNIDVEQAQATLDQLEREGKRAKALMPVHFAGLGCDMRAILHMAERFGVQVVEDAAHAFPTIVDGRMVGSIGRATVFSFYATKTICTGEGGMVTTDDEALVARMKTMRLHGINRDIWDRYTANKPSWYYEVVAPGFKYNMTDMAAALGIHQLRKGEVFRQRREAIALRYQQAFANLPVRLPAMPKKGDSHAWHLYVLRLRKEALSISRDAFIEKMCEHRIGTSVHFIPLHMHPYWRDRYGFAPDDFPQAKRAYEEAVSLPIYPAMTDEEVERVIEAVRAIVERYAR